MKTNNKEYTVSFATLGCKVNQFETEAMSELLEKEGFKILPWGEYSDIYVINTCAVTNESERKSRQFINKAKRMNSKSIVVAVGCSVQLNKEKISKNTSADIILGTKHKNEIGRLLKDKIYKSEGNTLQVEEFNPVEKFEELKINSIHAKTRANIKIQDGCNQYCSYCIIPYVRGPIRSRKYDDIIDEVKKLVHNGYKEVVLNGIHISSYGAELNKKDAFINLLENIDKINGLERIRLGSLEPNLITEEFMKRYSALKRTCNHFHLSLQSGSKDVLKRMNRKYTPSEYKRNVEIIRKYMPDSGITTDIIVGFPGETEEEFNETLNFVNDIKFSRIHVFKYSKRKGTKASFMDNQIDDCIKAKRSKTLIKLGNDIMLQFMDKLINKELPVLFETKAEDDCYEGYTTNYIKVLKKDDKNIKNKIMNVKITKICNDFLYGE